MPHIVLSVEQAQLVEQATEPVELRDELGKVLARILPLADQQALARIIENRLRNRTPYPASEVSARLQRLAEIRRDDGMDLEKARDLLRRMRAGERV
jgi:hypothetical protein